MSDMYSFDDDVEETPQGDKGSNPVKQLRDALKAAQKEAKESKKELEELRAFRTEYENEQKISTSAKSFEKFGLTQKHAELFHKVNPDGDVTDDAIKAFAEEYALPFKAPEPVDGDEPQSRDIPFEPADVGSTGDAGFVNREQLDAMYKSNPQRAIQLLKSGRVRWNNDDSN